MRASRVESFKISVSGVRVEARHREATSAKKRLALTPEAHMYVADHTTSSVIIIPVYIEKSICIILSHWAGCIRI